MKVILGDMSLEIAEVPESHLTYKEHLAVYQVLRKEWAATVTEFLNTAERCYVARYSSKPERSTVDEF